MNKEQDDIPPAWIKEEDIEFYTENGKAYVRRGSCTRWWLGCLNHKGEYRDVCYSSNKLWFRVKVFFFKITHPYWTFR